jgi:hypothetical protein
MQAQTGDLVKLRDGRVVSVTDAADPHPDAWRTYSKADWDRDGTETITSTITPETIFVGTDILSGAKVVSDMSEVVRIVG